VEFLHEGCYCRQVGARKSEVPDLVLRRMPDLVLRRRAKVIDEGL